MSITNKIIISIALVGWGVAIALFFGRLQINIVTNQSQLSTQSTIQATVNNNYLTESIIKVMNTNHNLTSQTNFSTKSMSIIKDMIFSTN